MACPTRLNRAFAAWLIAAVDGIVLQMLLGTETAGTEAIMEVFDLLLGEGIPQFLSLLE